MKETRILMGMPVTVEIVDRSAAEAATRAAINAAFDYFKYIDEKFSTYKAASEISRINRREIGQNDWSGDMKTIFALSEKTKAETDGYFDIMTPAGTYDPSGIVKGWAISRAAGLLRRAGFENFYVDAGGDIQPHGRNAEGAPWSIGIKNPWNERENVKVIYCKNNEGVATSGTYLRGLHIYNPKAGKAPADEIVSLTVIGPDAYEADRFATAAFAMGRAGTAFIENLTGFEACLIDKNKIATMTSGFEKYTAPK